MCGEQQHGYRGSGVARSDHAVVSTPYGLAQSAQKRADQTQIAPVCFFRALLKTVYRNEYSKVPVQVPTRAQAQAPWSQLARFRAVALSLATDFRARKFKQDTITLHQHLTATIQAGAGRGNSDASDLVASRLDGP